MELLLRYNHGELGTKTTDSVVIDLLGHPSFVLSCMEVR